MRAGAYYFDDASESSDSAIRNALRMGWVPCVLSSATTAIGLGSLAVSGLAAVREFGIFAAIGVITTLGSLLALMPGIILWKPIKKPPSRLREPSEHWQALLTIQQRHAGLISVVGVAIMIALGLGVAKLQASVRIETLFGNESRLIRDYAWIEDNVGPLVPIEVVAIVMTIVQAGFVRGIVAMIPNVFPSLALFGVLGWMDVPIDIGSIMTASVAMGIAVDDTLHFLNFFGNRVDAGASREQAVLAAYQHCGRAMIQTTLICGAGLAIFALSVFVPTARFAWMMVALLSAALIGDLILLPALLLNPLARFLERIRRRRGHPIF